MTPSAPPGPDRTFTILLLSAVALLTGAISAATAVLPDALPTPAALVLSRLTLPALLLLTLLQRDAPKRYRVLIAAGFGVLIAAELLALYPTSQSEAVRMVLSIVSYGLFTAAFVQRGGARLSLWIVPFIIAAIGLMALTWGKLAFATLSALDNLAMAIMTWAAVDAWRKSRYPGSAWAAGGALLWFASRWYFWIVILSWDTALPFETIRPRLAPGWLAADVAAWLIAMSVRSDAPSAAASPPPTV